MTTREQEILLAEMVSTTVMLVLDAVAEELALDVGVEQISEEWAEGFMHAVSLRTRESIMRSLTGPPQQELPN